MGKLPTSHISERKINDLTTALVLASNSKKFVELKEEVLSDFLLPMDSNNSAKINNLYRFLKFLENPNKSLKENIPEFAYTTIDLNSEDIDWTAFGNRYVINFENHLRPKLDALKSDLKTLKSQSEKELKNLYKAKELLDENNKFNPKLNNYISALEGNIARSNALDFAKNKIYNNVVIENFNSIKYKYVENQQKREFVIASMLEELPNIDNESLVEKISYEVINDNGNSVGRLNGSKYSLQEKLLCMCDKNMLFDSLLKKTVSGQKKTRAERVNLLLFMAQNYSVFNSCSQDEIKERFKLITSYGIEKLVDIREINYKLRTKISNNQTIINRNGDKYLITKRIL